MVVRYDFEGHSRAVEENVCVRSLQVGLATWAVLAQEPLLMNLTAGLSVMSHDA